MRFLELTYSQGPIFLWLPHWFINAGFYQTAAAWNLESLTCCQQPSYVLNISLWMSDLTTLERELCWGEKNLMPWINFRSVTFLIVLLLFFLFIQSHGREDPVGTSEDWEKKANRGRCVCRCRKAESLVCQAWFRWETVTGRGSVEELDRPSRELVGFGRRKWWDFWVKCWFLTGLKNKVLK